MVEAEPSASLGAMAGQAVFLENWLDIALEIDGVIRLGGHLAENQKPKRKNRHAVNLAGKAIHCHYNPAGLCCKTGAGGSLFKLARKLATQMVGCDHSCQHLVRIDRDTFIMDRISGGAGYFCRLAQFRSQGLRAAEIIEANWQADFIAKKGNLFD